MRNFRVTEKDGLDSMEAVVAYFN